MNKFIYDSSYVSQMSGYVQSTIRNKTPELNKLYPLFAIKVGTTKWYYDERAIAVFIIIKNNVFPSEYNSVEEFAIIAVYHSHISGK